MLNESEWTTINNILLEFYTIDNIDTLAQRLMNVLHMLINYTKGYFVLLGDKQQIIANRGCFVGIEDEMVKKYIDHYYNEDYLKYLYNIARESMVYQDSSIMDEEIRKQTIFYQKFLQVIDSPYGCGILVIHNSEILGIVNFYRNKELGDFSEKDIYILNILKFHIENMVSKIIQTGRRSSVTDNMTDMVLKYELTNREYEVLQFLCHGLSNSEICKELAVSLSTVKKHIYNLYIKTGVQSRTQLINLIYGSYKS